MFLHKERSDAMTNILKALAIAATLVTGTVVATSLALAGAGSPYPDQFKNPNLPYPSVGVGSGIPSQYRLGD
jgi:hypothetical protein